MPVLGGWSATLPLPDYGRVARRSPRKSRGRLHPVPKQAEFWLAKSSLFRSSHSVESEHILAADGRPKRANQGRTGGAQESRLRSVSFQLQQQSFLQQ